MGCTWNRSPSLAFNSVLSGLLVSRPPGLAPSFLIYLLSSVLGLTFRVSPHFHPIFRTRCVEGESALLALCIFFPFLLLSCLELGEGRQRGSQRKGGEVSGHSGFRGFSVLITDAPHTRFPETLCSGRSFCGSLAVSGGPQPNMSPSV